MHACILNLSSQGVAALKKEATNAATAELILVTHDFATTPCAIWTNRAVAAANEPPTKVVLLLP